MAVIQGPIAARKSPALYDLQRKLGGWSPMTTRAPQGARPTPGRAPHRTSQAALLLEHNRPRCSSVDPKMLLSRKSGSASKATGICRAGVVRSKRLSYALVANIRDSDWGGTTSEERRKIRRRPRRTVSA